MTKAPCITATALAALLTACQTTGSASPDTTAQGLADPGPPPFVEAVCGDCHAVEPPFLSPNPTAPTFEAIANREGLTRETLNAWLSDAHNYPVDMDFDLEENWVDVAADYIVTLQRDDYVPDP